MQEEIESVQEIAETKKGKSSKKSAKVAPSWVKVKPEELEKIVVELAKQGEAPAKIGLILRDKHGVPKSKMFGRRIGEILRAHGIDFSDKISAEKKIENLRKHIEKNKKDYPATRALTKKLWVVYSYEKNN